jgi:hypothetical protein
MYICILCQEAEDRILNDDMREKLDKNGRKTYFFVEERRTRKVEQTKASQGNTRQGNYRLYCFICNWLLTGFGLLFFNVRMFMFIFVICHISLVVH